MNSDGCRLCKEKNKEKKGPLAPYLKFFLFIYPVKVYRIFLYSDIKSARDGISALEALKIIMMTLRKLKKG